MQNIFQNMMQIENFDFGTALAVFGFTLMASLVIALSRRGSGRRTSPDAPFGVTSTTTGAPFGVTSTTTGAPSNSNEWESS
jgi:hypothetical protein